MHPTQFSPDGCCLLVITYNKKTVHIWSYGTNNADVLFLTIYVILSDVAHGTSLLIKQDLLDKRE